MVRRRFLHAISVGVRKNTIRLEIQALLKNTDITDEELGSEVQKIAAREEEHEAKMEEHDKASSNALNVAGGSDQKAIMAELARISARVNEMAVTKSDEVAALREQMLELQNRLSTTGVAGDWNHGGHVGYDGAVYYGNTCGDYYSGGYSDMDNGNNNNINHSGGFGNSRGGGYGGNRGYNSNNRGGYGGKTRGGYRGSNRGGGFGNDNRGDGNFHHNRGGGFSNNRGGSSNNRGGFFDNRGGRSNRGGANHSSGNYGGGNWDGGNRGGFNRGGGNNRGSSRGGFHNNRGGPVSRSTPFTNKCEECMKTDAFCTHCCFCGESGHKYHDCPKNK